MRIAGVDYSLRCPAVCVFDGNKKFSIADCSFHFICSTKKYDAKFAHSIHGSLLPEYKHECERYNILSEWVLGLVDKCDFVCVEDYAFAAKGKVFHIGENTGILKHKMWSKGINYSTIAPTQIKKFATGMGNARKEDMYAAFIAETKVDLVATLTTNSKQIKSPVSDLADAYYICKYGHHLACKP